MFRPTRPLRAGLVLLLAALAGDAVLPSNAFAEEKERRPLRLSDVKSGETESVELRRMADEKRLESIDRLRALLGDTPDGDRRAEMMLRLADLYFEHGKSMYSWEMDAFMAAQGECYDTAPDPDVCDRLKIDTRDSGPAYGKAVKLYEGVLQRYPRFNRADSATYFLGVTYQELEQADRSVDAFRKLVKLYPQSAYVPDAYVLIGEYYFDRNEPFASLRAYRQVKAYPQHRLYGYAMYKLAWSFYNVEEFGNAIETMKSVVSYSMDGSGTAAKQQLQDEALRDLVRFFADAGDMDEAYRYFQKLGRQDLIRSMLQRLAVLYTEQGKYELAIQTYRRLIAEDPNNAENPGYQEDIIQSYRRLGQRERVLDEIRRLRGEYGRSSAWWRSNAARPQAQADADATIEKALRKVATDFNEEAREYEKKRHPRAKEAFEAAVAAYRVYLEDYDQHPSAYAVHHDFGGLLDHLKRPDEAYFEYLKVVAMDPQGDLSKVCAGYAIEAAWKMVEQEGGKIQMKSVQVTKDTPPKPLTDWEQRLIEAAGRYAELYDGDKKVEDAVYRSAFLLYSRFHFTEAAEQFRKVIARWPGSRNAELSANLILDALNIKEQWADLKTTSKAFYEQDGLGSKKFKNEMYEVYASSSFKVIEVAQDTSPDPDRTADALFAFYEEFPTYEKADLALNNAAKYFYDAGRVADSMRVRHILIDDPAFGPKTRFYYNQIAALGYDYESIANIERAAYYYDKLLELYPAERKKIDKSKDDDKDEKLARLDEQAADALYSAALFREALGEDDAAIERYESLLTMFPEDERRLDIKLSIGRIYEDAQRWSDAASLYEAFYTKNDGLAAEYAFFARLHHGRALFQQGEETKARKLYKDTVALYKKLLADGGEPGAHTEFVAEMMYKLLEPDAAAYAVLRIENGPRGASRKVEDKAMKDSLQKKTKSLVEIEKAYAEIIETGAGAWGLAAVVALGRAYENMGTTLTESSCPSYLTADQCDIYKMTLEDRAYVQQEKAVAAYQLALEKSFDLKLYNDNTAYATRRLGQLRPDDFPRLDERIPPAGRSAERVRSWTFETSLD